ncbi:hypothetical protein [Corynebacterium pseudopelargi]|uniref:Uncharacterized protein n=1 Tax=Corynebacterium pseudopelargi TaxID=2080757 RepID=A0A3G6IXN4_9CORY|nr:hypothetical protein [Corynebacterium pseudopelargi]AZA08734.1 hypothetical protein CPPEL_03015 [Corynebacterium pseudopelargi]
MQTRTPHDRAVPGEVVQKIVDDQRHFIALTAFVMLMLGIVIGATLSNVLAVWWVA